MNNPADAHTTMSAVKLALMAKQMRAQAETALRADPIAIIGMACRVPGDGDTPELLWKQICAGVDAVREIPPDRWDGNAWYDPDLSASGKSATKWGGFLGRIDAFDAEYFGILPREAQRMDPQQRLLLEVAIEAIDGAGVPHERLRGSRTGVYIASYHNDYAQLLHNDIEGIELRTLTGTLHSVLANRLSYFLDLRGPSISIDTACSSSLVAIHTACQSLRFGETDLAISGGVSLMITPELMVSMSKVGFMSPTGRCKTFDSQADGFVRGEGCGVVVLKRLSDAIADSDRILAVIRGSAVNQDGRSTLLTAPNGPAQVALIREALSSAQVEPDRIGFFEAHGTGTALGDPIEVEAIVEAIGRAQYGSNPCFIGSIKANLGHLEAAAGVTGLIKAVLALRHEMVPPQANFSKLSPHISLDGTRLSVPTTLTPWPSGPLPRCAAVSSFGVGGTNANVVVEEAPRMAGTATDGADSARILPLSAQNPPALRMLTEFWVEFLQDTSASAVDLCHTASIRRTHYDHRIAVVGRSKEDFNARLKMYLDQTVVPDGAAARRLVSEAPRVGFVFSGQGPQWYAMGRELVEEEPVFREIITKCDELLRPLSGWSLLDELGRTEENSRLDQTEVAQPALFALQIALAALWKSWGVTPNAVVGHSVGEIAALHIAGVLELPEAIRVVWHRGRIMQQATGLGRMASVGITEHEARELIKSQGNKLSIGAVNAPRSVVLSGETAALEIVLATLTAHNINHRMLPVQYAFHSAQMTRFGDELIAQLGEVKAAPPTTAMYSTVTGGLAESTDFELTYFGRNLREPVRFANAIQAMLKDGCEVVIELGPQPVLASSIAECAANVERSPVILASLRRGRPERETALQACAGAYAAGCNLTWDRIQPNLGRVVDLPTYPWQRKRHWISTLPTRHTASVSGEHPLLGRRIDVAGIEAKVFESSARDVQNWLSDHRISGRLLLPCAAVLEAFAAAGRVSLDFEPIKLTGFAMHRPLVIPEQSEDGCETRWQVIAKETQDGGADLELFAATAMNNDDPSSWQRIANATAEKATAEPFAAPQCPASGCESVSADSVYERYKSLGAEFGETFRCLHNIERGQGFAWASCEIPHTLEGTIPFYAIHPVLVDAGLQLCSIAAASGSELLLADNLFVPIGADRVVIYPGSHAQLSACVRAREKTAATLVADVWLETPEGAPALTIEGMRFARAETRAAEASEDDDALYEIAWQRIPAQRPSEPRAAAGSWLLFADDAGTADALAARIEAVGGTCCRVSAGDVFERTSNCSWIINPADREHFDRLLAQGGWNSGNALSGVVHCWSFDIAMTERNASPAQTPELLAVGSVLHLVQALAKTTAIVGGALWLVTRGAQVVTTAEAPERLQPGAASLWGLASVIAIEQPSFSPRVIDLDPAVGNDGAIALFAELTKSRDARIALRDGERWTAHLQNYRHRANERAGSHKATLRQATVARPGTLDGVELQYKDQKPLRQDEVRI